MTREEAWKKREDDIDAMTEEQVKAYAKRLDRNAQTYFRAWQEAEERVTLLEMQLSDASRGEKCQN
jgi:hypothetical protein